MISCLKTNPPHVISPSNRALRCFPTNPCHPPRSPGSSASSPRASPAAAAPGATSRWAGHRTERGTGRGADRGPTSSGWVNRVEHGGTVSILYIYIYTHMARRMVQMARRVVRRPPFGAGQFSMQVPAIRSDNGTSQNQGSCCSSKVLYCRN